MRPCATTHRSPHWSSRVRDGDQAAWDELIERYSPLVWSICVRYQLARPDIDDVGQSVWLLLVEQIGRLREPAALPGWLATTTRRECLRILRGHAGRTTWICRPRNRCRLTLTSR